MLNPTAPSILGPDWEASEDRHMASLQEVPFRTGRAQEMGTCPFHHQRNVRGIGLLQWHTGEAWAVQGDRVQASSQPCHSDAGFSPHCVGQS